MIGLYRMCSAAEEETAMSTLICTGVSGLVAAAALSEMTKARKVGDTKKAWLWLLIAVPTGFVAVTNIAAVLAGMN